VSNNGNSGQGAVMVSVVIPAFRCAQYIAQAVSQFSSSLSDFEIIVVNTARRIQRFWKLLPFWKIRYLKQATRGRVARNTGILQARGGTWHYSDWRRLLAVRPFDPTGGVISRGCRSRPGVLRLHLLGEKPFANAFNVSRSQCREFRLATVKAARQHFQRRRRA
jgi:hypothetical protein